MSFSTVLKLALKCGINPLTKVAKKTCNRANFERCGHIYPPSKRVKFWVANCMRGRYQRPSFGGMDR